ncbi:MAG: hypothetical protein ACI4QN_04110 [Candidatus Coproplasma sp.]
MEPKYIVMIVVGSIYALLLLLYLGFLIERTNEKIHDERARQIYYSSKHLTKMEYDIAFPTSVGSVGQSEEEQVTMDEVINSNDKPVTDFEMPIFSVTEFEGSKEIEGKYNPDIND